MNNEQHNQRIPKKYRKERRLQVPSQDHAGTTGEDAEGTRRIPLTQGKFAIVDADMFEELNQWNWFCNSNGYAVRDTRLNGKSRFVRTHRYINDTPDHLLTDHINGNKLDNRKVNLRSATNRENNCNQGRRKDNASGYKGVHWHKHRKKWRATIGLNGKRKYLGLFSNPQDACNAYREAAIKLHGEFLNLTQPKEEK